jgi:hypothetical protein
VISVDTKNTELIETVAEKSGICYPARA